MSPLRDPQRLPLDHDSSNEKHRPSHLEQFEKILADQIVSLIPNFDAGFIDFAWLLQAQSVLLVALTNLDNVSDELESLRLRKEDKLVGEFLEECVKGLDACNVIRREIEMLNKRASQVKLVVEVLDVGDGPYSESQMRRAKKVLGEYTKEANKSDREKEDVYQLKVSTKANNFEGLQGMPESRILRTASAAGKHLLAIGGKLFDKVEDKILQTRSLRHGGSGDFILSNKYTSAIYAVKLVTGFLLNTICNSLPGTKGFPTVRLDIGNRYLWCFPLGVLQDKVLQEMDKRVKRPDGAVLWEVDQFSVCVKHLSDLLDCLLMLKRYPLLKVQEDELRKANLQLKRQHEAIEKGFKAVDRRTTELYKHLLFTRTTVSDKLSQSEA
eukprot:c24439_g1_i1 orf=219-1367(-)